MKDYRTIKVNFSLMTTWLVGSLFLFSCVPSLQEESSDPSCSNGASFDSKSRSCIGGSSSGSSSSSAPTPLTGSFSLTEDTASTENFSYTDVDGDLAGSCSSYSLNSGLVKRLTHEGVVVNSNSDEDDGHNILVKLTSAGSASISTATASSYVYINVNVVLGSTTSSSVASIINGDGDDDCSDGDASCYVNASINDFRTIDTAIDYTPISGIPCNCSGGTCSLDLTPTDNFNGSTDLYYNVTDTDGTSGNKLASVNIVSVNEAPNITITTGTLNVTEDVASAGTLATDAGFSIDDTNDGDPTGATLTYEVVTAPSGTLVLNSDGSYSYTTAADSTAADSFVFRVCDPDLLCSSNETINVSVTAVADAPYGTLTTITSYNEDVEANDPTDDQVTLTYTEPDGGETIGSCAITATSGVYISTDCACAANVCTVGLTGKAHTDGAASFSYTVTSGTAPTTSTAQAVNFTMNSVADNPFAFGTASSATSYEDNVGTSAIDANEAIEFNESSTHLPNYVDFTVNTAYDPDGDTSLTYSIVTSPTSGTITNCMDASGSSGTTDLTCTYTPSNGNLNNSATLTDSTTDKGFNTVVAIVSAPAVAPSS